MSSGSDWLRTRRILGSSLSALRARRERQADARGADASRGSFSNRWKPRTLLTGTWTKLAAPLGTTPGGTAVDNAQTMVLEPNGSVMVQGGGDSDSKAWYQLTPDGTGSYINGTWSTLQSMNPAGSSTAPTSSRTGTFSWSAARMPLIRMRPTRPRYYNPGRTPGRPLRRTPRTAAATTRRRNFGDGPSEVLADGSVLAGSQYGSQAYIYDPSTNAWTAAGASSSGNFGEEGWVKLADGSILDYKIGSQTAQRFVMGATAAQDQWVSAGSVPVDLGTNGGDANIGAELGPGLLLPNGNVFWIGATN